MNAFGHGVRVALISAFVIVAVVVGWASQSSSRNTIKAYVLTVSANGDGLPLDVAGAVWTSGSQEQVEVVRRTTPFTVEFSGNTVVAILKSSNGKAISVELREAGSAVRKAASSGDRVVLVQGLAPNIDWGFTKAF